MNAEIIENVQGELSNTRASIQGNLDADILTDRRQVPGVENGPFRSPTNRLIRGSLAHAMKLLRDDPISARENRGIVFDFAHGQRALTEKLDQIDLQYRDNGIEVEDGRGGLIHVSTLDVNNPQEGEDNRIPWVMIGGATSTSEANAALPIALAVAGEMVSVMTYPEQMRMREGGRGFSDKISNSGDDDFERFKSAIKSLGYAKINLVGHSLGGSLVLRIAADPEFAEIVEVQDVVALAPTGFIRKPVIGNALDFQKEGGVISADPEMEASIFKQGVMDANNPSLMGDPVGIKGKLDFALNFASTGRAAATKTINEGVLERAIDNVKGDVEVWTGSEDKIIREQEVHSLVGKMSQKFPNRISSYSLDGGSHNSFFTNAFGFVRARAEEQQARRDAGISMVGKRIEENTLERSGAEMILRQMTDVN